MNTMQFLDLFILFVLSCFFYIFFGKESLDKFLNETTITMEKKVDFDPNQPPAITICATKHGVGWKPDVSEEDYFYEFEKFCDSNNTEDAIECLKQNTFDLNETVKKAVIYPSTTTLPIEAWDTDITLFSGGQCHTLNSSFTVGADRTQTLRILLEESNGYFIIVHDPQLTTLNFNPETFPSANINLEPHSGLNQYYIKALSHVQLREAFKIPTW